MAATTLALVGCTNAGAGSSDSAAPAAAHTHGAGGTSVSLLVGDGTRDYEVGYTLSDVTLPETAGEPGEVGFRIQAYDGSVLRRFLTEQTKQMHLYLIRTDLAVYRHLHPTMADDGTWTAPVTLPEPGDYRVVTEFVAEDEGGNGDQVMLGKTAAIAGDWTPQVPERADLPEVGDDGTVTVRAEAAGSVGANGSITLVGRDAQGRPVKLGSYLGTFAHVTGVLLDASGEGPVVHMHPLGEPQVTEDGTRLTLHTEFERTGRYLAFVQLRVDGFLHTLPVALVVN